MPSITPEQLKKLLDESYKAGNTKPPPNGTQMYVEFDEVKVESHGFETPPGELWTIGHDVVDADMEQPVLLTALEQQEVEHLVRQKRQLEGEINSARSGRDARRLRSLEHRLVGIISSLERVKAGGSPFPTPKKSRQIEKFKVEKRPWSGGGVGKWQGLENFIVEGNVRAEGGAWIHFNQPMGGDKSVDEIPLMVEVYRDTQVNGGIEQRLLADAPVVPVADERLLEALGWTLFEDEFKYWAQGRWSFGTDFDLILCHMPAFQRRVVGWLNTLPGVRFTVESKNNFGFWVQDPTMSREPDRLILRMVVSDVRLVCQTPKFDRHTVRDILTCMLQTALDWAPDLADFANFDPTYFAVDQRPSCPDIPCLCNSGRSVHECECDVRWLGSQTK